MPAVVHVDGSGRVQTVSARHQPRLHALLSAFKQRTGVPMLLNTSLSVMGEPIVETPEDALWCLILTDLDFCTFFDRIVTRDASFRSMLDLVPVVAAEKIELAFATHEGGLSLELEHAELEASVKTRWGSYRLPLDSLTVALLEEIDGKETLGALIARVSESLEVDSKQVATAFRRLRMTGVVR